MKSVIIIALALAAVAVAAPPDVAQILRSEFVREPEGAFKYNFETENGIKQEAVGELKEAYDEDKKPHSVVVVRGSYSYPGEDGKPILVTYYADENGFHAEGDSIPKPAKR